MAPHETVRRLPGVCFDPVGAHGKGVLDDGPNRAADGGASPKNTEARRRNTGCPLRLVHGR